MAHTNNTQYYNLPQFIGTDVPGWLTDVNQAYAAIDAGMRSAQVKADQADQTAGQAANDVQALGTTVTTQASQIAAAAQSASSAQSAANAADAKADVNATAIDGLDGRVTALEQTGVSLVTHDYNFSGAISTAAGSFYRSNFITMADALPVGKTVDDVAAVSVVDASGFVFLFVGSDQFCLGAAAAATSRTATVRFVFK